MRVLVAGAAGYVGKFLCENLVNTGHSVIGLSLAEHESAVKATGADFFAYDLASKENLFMPAVDTVYYLAQSPYYREVPQRIPDLINVNISGLAVVAEAARRAGAQKFIYTSTGNVYRPSYLPMAESAPVRRDDFYGLSKLMGEYLVELYSEYYDVVICRMFTIYGPGQHNMLFPKIIERVKTGETIFLEPPEEPEENLTGLRLTPCFIDDAVRVLATLSISKVPLVINVASPEVVSIKEIAETAGRIVGKQPIFASTDKTRKGNLIADSSLLSSLLLFNFTTLGQGLQKTIKE